MLPIKHQLHSNTKIISKKSIHSTKSMNSGELEGIHGLLHQEHQARGLRQEGDRDRSAGDAGPDGSEEEGGGGQTAEGRQNSRLHPRVSSVSC